jgi:hypothetical protein
MDLIDFNSCDIKQFYATMMSCIISSKTKEELNCVQLAIDARAEDFTGISTCLLKELQSNVFYKEDFISKS